VPAPLVQVDGDQYSNQMPVAIPDDGEIIRVHKVPVNRLLDEIDTFREKGFEVDARSDEPLTSVG
jgi:hypothetical protein